MADPAVPSYLLSTIVGVNHAPAERTLKLLLVEGSQSDASTIVRLLARHGYRVEMRRVEDAQGMQEALASQLWDAVIAEYVLPHWNGTEALRLFRGARLDIPFLIVSGQIGEDVAVAVMRAGADDYVVKANLWRLVPALQRSLRAAEARRNRRQAESARRAMEARLLGIANNLPGVVFQVEQDSRDGTLRVRYLNGRVRQFLGCEAAEVLSDPGLALRRVEPGEQARIRALLDGAAASGSAVNWDNPLSPLGEIPAMHVAVACAPRGESERVLLWEGVMVDISAQKTAERALEKSQAELRRLALHLETVREEQRKAIAREIHDDIGGALTALRFELARLARGAAPEQKPQLDTIDSLLDSARQAAERIMYNLRPSVLDHGIVASLEWLTRNFSRTYSIPCNFRSNQSELPPLAQRDTALFRIAQEALTNVAKHANATAVEVEVFADSATITLEVSDNGRGPDPAALEADNRFGVRGMRERATSLGGWLEIESGPEHGTTVMVALPVTETQWL